VAVNNDDEIPIGEMLGAYEDERDDVKHEVRELARELVRSHKPVYLDEAERMVIAAMLVDADKAMPLIEDVGLDVSDFFVGKHRHVYGVMAKLWSQRRPVDSISVCDALNRLAVLDEVGGASWLSQVESSLPTASAAGEHAKLVLEKSRTRKLAQALGEGLHYAKLGQNPLDIIEGLYPAFEDVQRSRGGGDFVDMPKVVRAAYDALPVNSGGKVKGISTGFIDVNRMFRYVEGDLVIIAARPSMGKTQWVLDSLIDASVTEKEPSAIFSLEMTAEQLTTRLIGAKSGVDLGRLSIPPHEKQQIIDAGAAIACAPLFIDDTPGLTLGDIRARSRAADRKRKLKLVVVDYLQLMETSKPSGNKAEDVGEISKGLKRLARELKCTVVALSQLNRGVEARMDKRPMMSDLRESGAIEQDADVIGFLYREEYYSKNKCPDDKKGIAEFIVGKHRNGPTGMCELHFSTEPPSFSNLARERDW